MRVGCAIAAFVQIPAPPLARWPDLQKMLSRSAVLLRSTRRQLEHTLEHRDEYDASLKQSVALAESFGALLPLFTDHLAGQLAEQEEALDQLGRSIDDFGASMPVYARTAAELLQAEANDAASDWL